MEWIKYNSTNSLRIQAKEHGLAYMTVYDRVNKLGWDLERALTTPPRKMNRARNGYKICPLCDEKKSITEFKKHKRDRWDIYTYCNSCKGFAASNRKKVLDHYGNGTPSCELCGEDRYGALDLDHKYGGGYEERKIRSGANIYTRVIKEGYPLNFRILCRNCNWLEFMRMNDWRGDRPE